MADGERAVQVEFKDYDSGELQRYRNAVTGDSDDDLA